MAAAPPPRRGKNKNAARTVWPPSLSSLLLPLVLLAVLLLITPVHSSRPQQGFDADAGAASSSAATISGQKGSELPAWRRDAIRPDRMTDLTPPPAPKANSNVPGGPFG